MEACPSDLPRGTKRRPRVPGCRRPCAGSEPGARAPGTRSNAGPALADPPSLMNPPHAYRRGRLWVVCSRHGHQRKTQRRTHLDEPGQQQGNAGADGPFIATGELSQGAGLRICDRTRHGRGGELGSTRHQLGFQALSCLGRRKLFSQTQHWRTGQTALLQGQIEALAAASPDVQRNSCRCQLGLDHVNRPVPAKCGELGFGSLHLRFPSVAGCRLRRPVGNRLTPARQHKAGGRCHRPAHAAEPEHETHHRQNSEAPLPEAQRQQWCGHLEDIGSDAGDGVGGLVHRVLAERQPIAEVGADAHRAERCGGGITDTLEDLRFEPMPGSDLSPL